MISVVLGELQTNTAVWVAVSNKRCVCEKQKRLCYFSPLAVTVSKKLGVQLCVVGCNKTKVAKPVETGTKSSQYTQRSSFQDSYKKTEIWALQDLNLIDGRDPDVVSR